MELEGVQLMHFLVYYYSCYTLLTLSSSGDNVYIQRAGVIVFVHLY